MLLPPNLNNFMYVHKTWVDPSYVLSSDHITLHGVNKTHAWFCVTHPAVDVYSTKFYPFVFANQYMLAEELVIVRLDVFHEMAGTLFVALVSVGTDSKHIFRFGWRTKTTSYHS